MERPGGWTLLNIGTGIFSFYHPDSYMGVGVAVALLRYAKGGGHRWIMRLIFQP
jgi:hypothetical protein